MNISLEARIVNGLGKLYNEITGKIDKKDNKESLLAEAFFWDTLKTMAGKKSEAAWDRLRSLDLVPEKDAINPGEVREGEVTSAHFSVNIKATEKVRRFSVTELCTLLKKSKYRVPESVTAELAEAAKVPGSSLVSFKVVERGTGAF